MVKKGKKSSTKTCLCSTCSAELSDNCNSISCDSCNNWHHGSCVNLSAENISFLGSSDNLFWKCNSCITIKVTPFKTLEAKIDSVLFKLEEPRTAIQPAQPTKPIEVLQNNKYDHHYRVRISGISESKEKSFIDRQFADKEKVEEVFKKLNVNCPIIETNRRCKLIEDRQRKLIATFSSPWDGRLVISSAIQKKLFETDKILITTDLSPSDLAIERKLLSKRYELISNGVPKDTLKIRYLKLYQGNKEVNVD